MKKRREKNMLINIYRSLQQHSPIDLLLLNSAITHSYVPNCIVINFQLSFTKTELDHSSVRDPNDDHDTADRLGTPFEHKIIIPWTRHSAGKTDIPKRPLNPTNSL